MSSYKVNRERWADLSIFEQMGNIYSEVGGTFKAIESGDKDGTEQAVARAIELFDATADVLVAKNPVRLKEVLRAKEQFLTAVYGDDVREDDRAGIDKYFYNFAVAARIASS